MSSDIRIAVVGTGYIAKTIVAAIADVKGLRVNAICSSDEQRGRAFAATFSSDITAVTFEQALADPTIDAVYVANETAAHALTSIKALEAGKAVLCEKPFASNSIEARAIVEAARSTGNLYMEAMPTPFLPAVQAALHEAHSGNIGVLRHFAADFGYPTTPDSHPGSYASAGGGVLLDRAVYVVALALVVMGPVELVHAQLTRDANDIDVEASLLLTHRGGSISQLATSLTSLLGNTMTICGTFGSIVADAPLLATEKFTVQRISTPERLVPSTGLRAIIKKSGVARQAAGMLRGQKTRRRYFGKSPYYHELVHFRNLCRAGAVESPVMRLDVSMEVIAVLDAARSSA